MEEALQGFEEDSGVISSCLVGSQNYYHFIILLLTQYRMESVFAEQIKFKGEFYIFVY